MPTMKAILKITGLAYCHLANMMTPAKGELQALFLHADERHQLRLIVRREKDHERPFEAIYYVPNHTEIGFTPVHAISVQHPGAEPGSGEDFTHIVNIDQLHHPTAKLRFKPSDMEMSYLSIREAICYTQQFSSAKFDVWRIYRNTKTLERPGVELGKVLGIDFDIDGTAGREGYIDITYDPEHPPVRIPYESDCKYTVTFENECPTAVCASDFRYYYQILDGGGTEFEETPVFPPPKNPPSDSEASCNPVQGDPPDCTLHRYFSGLCP
jgi:hypothetical protein